MKLKSSMYTLKWNKIQGKVRILDGEASRALKPLEYNLIRGASELIHPPIFILGAPRSGTTLFYQSLTHYYRFAYFNNLSMWFPHAPVLAAHISHSLVNRPSRASFDSRYGQTAGMNSPSEFGRFWSRWFYREPDEDKEKPLRQPPELLRSTVAAVSARYETSVVAKNTYFSLWIRQLSEIFPEAVVVFVRRDPLFTAQSLLKARIDVNRDSQSWFGVKPPGWQALENRPYWEQIAGQVVLLEQHIEQDLATYYATRWYELRYEDFCQTPRRELEAFGGLLEANGVTLQRRADVPVSFPVSHEIKVSKQDFDRLHSAIRQFKAAGRTEQAMTTAVQL